MAIIRRSARLATVIACGIATAPRCSPHTTARGVTGLAVHHSSDQTGAYTSAARKRSAVTSIASLSTGADGTGVAQIPAVPAIARASTRSRNTAAVVVAPATRKSTRKAATDKHLTESDEQPVTAARAASDAENLPPPDPNTTVRLRSRKRKVATSAAVAQPKQKLTAESTTSGPAIVKPGGKRVKTGPTRELEQALWMAGCKAVAGVDEAGRGPLAGPVVAAACVIPEDVHIEGIDDSKKMSEAERERVYEELTQHPRVRWAAHTVTETTIDEINILQAALLAMRRSVEQLAEGGDAVVVDHVLIDGNRTPPGMGAVPVTTVIKGDSKSCCIAAASIIAKVTRDRLMHQYDAQFPEYGFARHKGYCTADHVAALHKHGPCAIHRRSFEPVKSMVLTAAYR